MKKIILGLVAAATVAAPIALTAGSANADTPSGSTCTPSAATSAVTHTEYQWAALVAKGGLHWEYKWTATPKNPTTDILHVWVKSLDLSKRDLPQIRKTVVDTPAKDATICSVTLPTSFEGEGTYTVVVPFTKGVDTFIIGARGYDEHTPITKDSVVTKADADQFWVGHKAQPGYVIANPAVGNNDRTLAQWHIDFTFANPTSATGDVTWKYGEVTGTINVNANVANGGSFDYTDSTGQTLHGVVTPGTLVKDGSKVIFTGTITDSNVEWNIDRPFTGVVIDGDVDQIGVFVDRDVDGLLADVTGGNLTVH